MGDPKQQTNDFEPGIAPSGLFWTVPIPPSALQVAPDAGRARFHLADRPIPDFGNFFNAIAKKHNPPPKPSRITFDVRWSGGNDPREIRDARFGFSGTFVDGSAHVSFRASNNGSHVVYHSVATGQTTLYAGVGRERNGIFFS